ncbi:SDR family oxidoreductase [Polynucleobacter sp. 31A-FELB]|uniref:UDP-glucose 4-epimerase family protein n=1 Tax=Polynucleobacter sp. 31A-FELB TaxID=2689096 RepID=UPI001C0A951C|nr:SDR family oxidoreductase [Polynucleobacter sp. 31A-FELB]MBU3588111.1 SDR family oxidoreductase [Polynucleobacter sp. 31A-FELB]
MKSLLITGANGFVGRALVEQSAAMGYQVTACTRKPAVFAESVHNFVVSDFSHQANVCDALKGVDVVIHLAARVHVMKDATENPLVQYQAMNVDATLALAKQAVTLGIKRFIYMSSIKVNGESTAIGVPFTPADYPAPSDPYGVSKMQAEEQLLALARLTGMEVVIIRPPLIYGPRVKANFASMMKWVRSGMPLPLGGIHNLRSMVFLGNLIDLILVSVSHPDAKNQVFLVSDDEDISVASLIRKLAAAMHVRTVLIPIPSALLKLAASLIGKRSIAQRLCDSLQVDISKTKSLLGWSPPFTLEQGLAFTVKWYLRK